jgi:hypothetical protein
VTGINLPACLTNLNGESFSINGEVYDFCTIKNFSLCFMDLVVLIEYTNSKKIIKCTSEDEFIFLLKKMETAHNVFIFTQENLCH